MDFSHGDCKPEIVCISGEDTFPNSKLPFVLREEILEADWPIRSVYDVTNIQREGITFCITTHIYFSDKKKIISDPA